MIDFRKVGVQLCRSVLKRGSLRVIEKSLEAFKSKAHHTSACLNLLTECVAFDGGACARSIHVQRYATWKRLPAFLITKERAGDFRKGSKGFTLRSNALRFTLANLRHQSTLAMEDLLLTPRLVALIFRDLSDDPGDLIVETLKTVKDAILLREMTPIKVKRLLLTESTLCSIGRLYKFGQINAQSSSNIRETCHEILMLACTNLKHGVLVEQTGWYPPGTAEARLQDHSVSTSAIQTTPKADQPVDGVLVRNAVLGALIQTLRPHTDLLQRKLVLEVFRSAPELVADYFLKKKPSFQPTLSAAWLGHATFVAAVLQLPVPLYSLSVDGMFRPPPPVPVMMQNILPQWLDQSVLTRCINQESSFITFLTTEMMASALRKLHVFLRLFNGDERPPEWVDAAESLTFEVSQRLPEAKHIMAAFRGSPKESRMLKQSLASLILLYYQVIPRQAIQAHFDVSLTISESLEATPGEEDSLAFPLLTFESCLELASLSSDMRWWNKPGKA